MNAFVLNENFNMFCVPCDVSFLVVYFFVSLIFSCLGKKVIAKLNRALEMFSILVSH